MEQIKTAYVFKLYQSRKNKYLHQQIDIAGIVYNHCIALKKKYYKLFGKSLNKYQLQKHLTKQKKKPKNTFWKLLGSQAIQDITDRIERGYLLFFRNVKLKMCSKPPSFKKVKKYKSFTLKQAGYKFLDNNKIKIGKRTYKYFKSRSIEGSIKNLTIKRDTIGDIYLVVIVEKEKEMKNPIMTGKIAGMDFGLKTFLTLSNNTKEISPLFFKKHINEIIKSSKKLSRKKDQSVGRKKAKINLAKIHKKLKNLRRNYFFLLSHKLLNQFDYLFLEDLNIKGMQKLWGRKTSDVSYNQFIKILEHIAKKKGKVIYKIDRYYPSSKTCNNCSYIHKALSLKERNWTCPKCLESLDRDYNAAKNILREGTSSLGLDIVRLENSSDYCLSPESNAL